MIYVTAHTLMHYEGRCRRHLIGSKAEKKAAIALLVEGGRMVSPQDAAAFGLWLNQCRGPGTAGYNPKETITPDRVICAGGVLFLLDYSEGVVVVVTCALRRKVVRWVARTPSKTREYGR